jgi:DNA-binding transcriptional LysR family regulator
MLGILGLVKAGVGMTIVPGKLIDYCPNEVVIRPLAGEDDVIETIAVWRRPADAKLEQFLYILQRQARQ